MKKRLFLLNTQINKLRIGLYIHIPFCKKKCPYCDFYSITHSFDENIYLSALKNELTFWKNQFDFSIKTLYIGGGTPSLLSIKFYHSLFDFLSKYFSFSPKELTIEANPETLTFEKIKKLKDLGFNRISLGVQTFSKRGLKFLGRVHLPEQVLKVIDGIITAGFNNFSLDFIYDWKGQGLKTLEKDLKTILSLSPPHVSFYEFTLEKDTPMYNYYKTKIWSSEKRIKKLCKIIESFLKNAGYERYEISNYAIKGKKCLHNLIYWKVKPYLGVGPSAVSRIGSYRWQNVADYFLYTSKLLTEKEPPFEITEVLDEKELLKEYIFMGLRLKEGISIKKLYHKGYYFFEDALKLLEKNKLVSQEGGRLSLTFEGKFVHNSIVKFLWDNLVKL